MSSRQVNRLASAKGAHRSWANTVDRAERTAPARRRGPGSLEYWIERKRADPRFACASDAQIRQAAESAKGEYFADLALRSARARSTRKAAS